MVFLNFICNLDCPIRWYSCQRCNFKISLYRGFNSRTSFEMAIHHFDKHRVNSGVEQRKIGLLAGNQLWTGETESPTALRISLFRTQSWWCHHGGYVHSSMARGFNGSMDRQDGMIQWNSVRIYIYIYIPKMIIKPQFAIQIRFFA